MTEPHSNTYVTVWQKHPYLGRWMIDRSYFWHYAKQVIAFHRPEGEEYRAFPHGLDPNETEHSGWTD